MVYSDIIKMGLILPKKKLYTVKDVHSVVNNSLFRPVNGKTLTEKEAAFIVKSSAIYHDTDYSRGVAIAGSRANIKQNPSKEPAMTAHEKRVNLLVRLHGFTPAAAEKRAREIEKSAPKKKAVKKTRKNPATVNVDIGVGSHNARGKARNKFAAKKNPLLPTKARGILAKDIPNHVIHVVKYASTGTKNFKEYSNFPGNMEGRKRAREVAQLLADQNPKYDVYVEITSMRDYLKLVKK